MFESLYIHTITVMFTARTFFNNFREDHEMLHLRDLQKLEGVLSPSHLEVTCSPDSSYALLERLALLLKI